MGRDAQVWRCPFEDIPEDADLDDYELAHTRIGNLALVVHLRELIRSLPNGETRFPILLQQVLHHGTLTGDHIAASEVHQLIREIDELPTTMDIQLDQFKSEFGSLCQLAVEKGLRVDF
ncbi:MAG: hypothetical protein AAGI37_05615 [Planctomycetota bacterium]